MNEPEWNCEHCEAANSGEWKVGEWCWRCGLWQGYDYTTYPAKPRDADQPNEVQK
jgi:hypothetical protein